MNSEITEEEMRRAFFGSAEVPAPLAAAIVQDPVPGEVILPVSKPLVKKKAPKALAPRLKVTLRVGTEFEGETFEFTD